MTTPNKEAQPSVEGLMELVREYGAARIKADETRKPADRLVTGDIFGAIREYATRLAQVQVAQGWKLVPVEPTQEMIAGFWGEITRGDAEIAAAKDAYRAMLSASPASPGEAVQTTQGGERG